ncbi:hypothetical protein [Halotalea alkalilenta]|uniref:hypothetical protein n=1 Tax=Halotalea alkalilenta TaxID=376489 RepID=UPI0005B86B49|nr:hypothetical protein [Halotalea alkalilenta]
MRAYHHRLPLALAVSCALLAGAATAQAQTQSGPQGLYSASELNDANVYLRDNPNQAIGEVEDILLGEDMSVQALVIDVDGLQGSGDQDRVIERGQFTVQTLNDDDIERLEYRVTLDLDADGVRALPVYDNDWWNQSRAGLNRLWEQTQQGAQSAWESTKETTSNLLDRAREAIND